MLAVLPLRAQASNADEPPGLPSKDVPRSLLSLNHDNDFFLLTDRYYSFGLDLSYHRSLPENPGGFRSQVGVSLFLKAYTPRNIESDLSSDFDRPYAGLSGLSLTYGQGRGRLLFSTTLMAGLSGRRSGTGAFQRWYHNNVVRYKTPSWSEELPSSAQLNVYGEVLREWRLLEGDFGIEAVPILGLALGSWQQHAEAGGRFHFGRKDPAETSLAYGRLGSMNREVFFSLGYRLRSIWWDGSYQGASWGGPSPLYVAPMPWMHTLNFDFVHRYGRNSYRFRFQYDSPGARGNLSHKFMGFMYGYAF